jgi:branched-chain amino acid transport system ATP-binding protein
MRNVEKNFGGVRAIDNFSVTLEPGKIHGLIGPNGLRYKLKKLSSTSLR